MAAQQKPEASSDLDLRIAALRDVGAADYDPPAWRFIERLAAAAAELPPAAAARVRDRAAERIGSLEQQIGEGDPSVEARRVALLQKLERRSGGAGAPKSWIHQLESRAKARGLATDVDEVREPLVIAERMYNRSRDERRSDRVVDQAKGAVPEVAGRYHAPVVCAELLETLSELGAGYLPAQLRRLEMLALLQAFIDAENE
ncbi:MAG: DUF2894 domain-containing protein [Myxococcota bacterium]